jgi:hypothetical protein
MLNNTEKNRNKQKSVHIKEFQSRNRENTSTAKICRFEMNVKYHTILINIKGN